MRRIPFVLAAFALGCAHISLPPYGAELRFVRADRDTVSGPNVLVTRSRDGSWRGWTCASGCPTEIDVTAGGPVIGQLRVPVQIEESSVTFQAAHVDLVLRRLDGGPMPLEAAIPLWIATQFDTWSGGVRSLWAYPSHECLQVRGLGTVEVSIVETGTSPDGLRCGPGPEPRTLSL